MELKNRIKKYFDFNSEEIQSIIISVLILAFVVSFREWGVDKFDLAYGIKNLLDSVLIVGLALIVRISIQKIDALRRGYRLEWKLSFYGLLVSLALVFISNGLLFVLIPGGIIVHMMDRMRIGKFRYGLNRFDVALIGFSGVLSNIVLAMFFKAMMLVSSSNLLDKAVLINVLMAVFAMLPIHPLEGSRMFVASRLTYFFTMGCIVGAGISLLYFTSILTAIFGSLLVGGVVWLLYLIFVEN